MFGLCNVYFLYKMAARPKIDLSFPALNRTLLSSTIQGVSLKTVVVLARNSMYQWALYCLEVS